MKSGGCVFDGNDHEGQVGSYRVPQGKWHALLVKPRRIGTTTTGREVQPPIQPEASPLCERHAKVMGVPLA
jgi:hypothetical protein